MGYRRRLVIALIGGLPAVAAAIIGAIVAAHYTTSWRDASDRDAACGRATLLSGVIATEIETNDRTITRASQNLEDVSKLLDKYIEEPGASAPLPDHGYFGLRASALDLFLLSDSSRFADPQGLTIYMAIYDRYRYATEVKRFVDDALVEYTGSISIPQARSLANQLKSRVDQLRDIYSSLLDVSSRLPNVVRDYDDNEPIDLIPLDSDGNCTQ